MNHMQRMRSLEDLARVNHALAHIGGGEAMRRLTLGDREVRRGEVLSREELLRIPAANLKAMVANRYIALSLSPVEQKPTVAQPKEKSNARSRARSHGGSRKKRGRNKQAA